MIPKSRRRSRIARLQRRLEWLQSKYASEDFQHPARAEARALAWAIRVIHAVDWSLPAMRATLDD